MKSIATARLGSRHLEREELKRVRRMTPSQKLTAVLEISDFVGGLKSGTYGKMWQNNNGLAVLRKT